MNCQLCRKNKATVHITDVKQKSVPDTAGGPAGGGVESTPSQDRHVCAICAQELFSIVVQPVQPKVKVNIWKLLQVAKENQAGEACPDCGMTLAEFRSKGRLGCPKDYELFWAHLAPLLERVHNATAHTDFTDEAPDPQVTKKRRHLHDLRAKLETAIREEAYEHAAELRDAIEELEKTTAAPE